MNSIVKETLDKLEQCDDLHNRCDYLMEHSEITYLLEYIKGLQDNSKKLRDELLEYEIKISNLQKALVELRVNCGKSVY